MRFCFINWSPTAKETYAPVLRMRLAARLADPEKPTPRLQQPHESLLGYLWINLKRPVILLFQEFDLLHAQLVHGIVSF